MRCYFEFRSWRGVDRRRDITAYRRGETWKKHVVAEYPLWHSGGAGFFRVWNIETEAGCVSQWREFKQDNANSFKVVERLFLY